MSIREKLCILKLKTLLWKLHGFFSKNKYGASIFLLKLFFSSSRIRLKIPSIICCGTRLSCLPSSSTNRSNIIGWQQKKISIGYQNAHQALKTNKTNKTAILFVRTHFKQCKQFLSTKRFAQYLKCDEKKVTRQGIPTMKIIQFIHFIWMENVQVVFNFLLFFGLCYLESNRWGCNSCNQLLTSTPHTKNQISQNNNRCRKLWSLYYYYDTNYFAHTII